MKNNKPLSGIIPPMITPLKDPFSLDVKGLECLIEHIIAGGVHGLFILGTSGEGPSLSHKLRHELIEKVCNQVGTRVPILVGISDTSVRESIDMAEHAMKWGANAVVAAAPYYFTPNQDDLKSYFNILANHCPLPLFLYNMPSHTKVSFEPDTVKSLSEHENIIGLKDSSGDLIYLQKIKMLMEKSPEFSLLVGPEELLMQSIFSGAHGGVCGGANMFPKLYVDMYEAAMSRDFEKIESLQKQIMHISSTIYSIKTYGSGYLQGLKNALSIMGICNEVLAAPHRSFGENEKKIIRDFLSSMDLAKLN